MTLNKGSAWLQRKEAQDETRARTHRISFLALLFSSLLSFAAGGAIVCPASWNTHLSCSFSFSATASPFDILALQCRFICIEHCSFHGDWILICQFSASMSVITAFSSFNALMSWGLVHPRGPVNTMVSALLL